MAKGGGMRLFDNGVVNVTRYVGPRGVVLWQVRLFDRDPSAVLDQEQALKLGTALASDASGNEYAIWHRVTP